VYKEDQTQNYRWH